MKIRLISQMTRVEGTSELVIHRKGKNVSRVTYKMPTTRDFQPVLIGQRIEDLPRLVARICGICPVAHRLAAIKATENILDITPTPLAETLRELALLGEVIRSHTYSAFFCTFPDLLDMTEDLSRKDLFGKQAMQPRLLSHALKLYRSAESLIAAVAGNTNMAYRMVVGGVLQNISPDEQDELMSEIHATLSTVKWAKELCKSLLNEVRGEIQVYELESPAYISSFDTDTNRFYGTDEASVFSENGTNFSFPSVQFPEYLSEKHSPEAPTRITYSITDLPDTYLLAGPHARLAALQAKSRPNGQATIQTPNLFQAGLLRLDEIEFCITRAINLLQNEWRPDDEILVPWRAKGGIAGSALEAPRGILIHRLNLNNKGKITGIQIRVPTELNASAIVHLVHKVTESCLDLGWSEAKTLDRVKMAIRCFDPCVSCATHTNVRFRE